MRARQRMWANHLIQQMVDGCKVVAHASGTQGLVLEVVQDHRDDAVVRLDGQEGGGLDLAGGQEKHAAPPGADEVVFGALHHWRHLRRGAVLLHALHKDLAHLARGAADPVLLNQHLARLAYYEEVLNHRASASWEPPVLDLEGALLVRSRS